MLLAFSILTASRAFAAVSEYTFSSTLDTYTHITGGTVLGTTANDNESFNAIPLGFTFIYNGVAYSQVSVQSNGFLAFGSTVASSTVALSVPSGTNNLACAMNRDLMSAGDGSLSYLLSGTAPNRVFTVQWHNYRRTPTEAQMDIINFQIQLHENGSLIKFCYGNTMVEDVVSARTFQVGLRGDAAADFNNRSTTTDWTATTAGIQNTATCWLTNTVYPPPGLIFTYSPPATGEAHLSFDPASLEFGKVEVGQSKDITLTVYATGSAGQAIIVDLIYFQYGNMFQVVNLPVTPLTLHVPETLALTVRFTPGTRYDQTDTLHFMVAGGTPSDYPISIHGKGHINPWDVNPPYYSFGNTTGQPTSLTKSFWIGVNWSYGMSTISLNQVGTTGDPAFSVPAGNIFSSSGSPITLPTWVMLGDSVRVVLNYDNAPPIGFKSGTLDLVSQSEQDTLHVPVCANDAILTTLTNTIDFGMVEVGEVSTFRVYLDASGVQDSTYVITAADIAGGGSIYSLGWQGGILPPIEMAVPHSLWVDVYFSPDAPGTYDATVQFWVDDGSLLSIPITGSADYFYPPMLDVLPTSHDFGPVLLGDMASVTINLYASGMFPGDLTINSIYWSGDPGFSVNYVFMPPHMMSTGESIFEEVLFSPTTAGGFSGNLVIVWNDTQYTYVPISGSGYQLSASLMVVPSSLPFGDVEVLTPVQQTVRIHATGDAGATIDVSTIDLTGDGVFSLVSPPATPHTLVVPDSLDVVVQFYPADVLPYGATLTITDSQANSFPVPISGNGYHVPYFSWLESSLGSVDFGDLVLGGGANQGITITAVGDPFNGYPVEVTSLVVVGSMDFTAYAVESLPYTMNLGENRTIYAQYYPTAVGPTNAWLYVYYNGGEPGDALLIPLNGNCLAPAATLSVAPSSVDFGSIPALQMTQRELSLSASGSPGATVTVNSIYLPPGLGFNVFSAPEVPFTLTAPESAVVTLAFTPDTATTYSNTLEISESTDGTHYIPLYGTATPPSTGLEVDFSAVPLSGHAPLTVQFTDTSVSDPTDPTTSIEGWRWDMDFNGTVDSYQQNPVYVYDEPGLYSVKLVVFSYAGQMYEEVKENYVSVGNTPPSVLPGAPQTLSFNEDTVGGPLSLLTVFTDADGDTLLFDAAPSPHLMPEIVANSQLRLHPDEDWYGTEDILLTAWDPFYAEATHTISVTVLPLNDAPSLDIPPDMYFIHNSDYVVDFAQYITDADNAMAQLSIMLEHIAGPGDIGFVYLPVNAPNVPGQFQVKFSTPQQNPMIDSFRITVNDNAGRAIAQEIFDMHLIDHFEPVVELGDQYQFAGQTVLFFDATLGNPDWWLWELADTFTYTQQNPQHTFPFAGSYNVRLTLGNTQANEMAMVFLPDYITLVGTSVTPGNVPVVWDSLSSPYNLFGGVQIPGNLSVTILPNVEVNLFGGQPLLVNGTLNAHRARFRPQGGDGTWGGLMFLGDGNFRIPSNLTDCDIVDAILPIAIEDASPNLSGIAVSLSDTTGTMLMPGAGLLVTGASAPVVNGLEIHNYAGGLVLDSEGTADRTTPTLSNIRVRNSVESSRAVPDGSTGASIYCDATIDSLEIENCATGIVLSGNNRNRSTPTLSNIRIRNSVESSRTILTGMVIEGGIAPQINLLDISGVDNGIFIQGSGDERSTPTLSNIRVRNSNESSRNDDFGLGIENIGSLIINTGEITGFYHGVRIDNSPNTLGTPTLSNIRVRNSNESSRQDNIGIEINGPVAVTLTGSRVENYPFGIKYEGSGRAGIPSAKITQTVVSNALPNRLSSIGIQLHNLGRTVCRDDSIGGFNVGVEVLNDGIAREYSAPSLNGLTISNSLEAARYDNAGVFLGSSVGGSITGCEIEGARVGIFIADGNLTRVLANRARNCEIGVKAASSGVARSISRQEILLDAAFAAQHPSWDFQAFDVSLAGPWTVHNNTVIGYEHLLRATNTEAHFLGNIGWTQSPLNWPFTLTNSLLEAGWNDLNTSQPWPGTGNINLDPGFANPAALDYHIGYNSPCVDAGGPVLAPDPDGSIADIGAHIYPHRADFTASERFVQTGTTVQFTNTSFGHAFPFSTVAWDMNADGSLDAISTNWEYTFTTPGMYNVRLTMSSGPLQDIRTYNAFIVVQSSLLQPPQNLHIARSSATVDLHWDPVTLTVDGTPISVEYYIVYASDDPFGMFDFAGYTTNFATQYSCPADPAQDHRFYVVLGYAGSMRQLLQFIRENRCYRIGTPPVPEVRNSKE